MGKNFTKTKRTNGAYIRTAVFALLFTAAVISIGYSLQRQVTAATSKFGFTTVGTTPETLSMGYKIADASTAPSSGTVDSLSFYIDGKASSTGSGTVTAALYADAGGTPLAVTPTNLLGSSAPKTIPAGQNAGWVTFGLTSPVDVVAGKRYWITITAGTKTVVRVFTGSIVDDKIWAQNSSGATPTATFGQYFKGKGPLSAYVNYANSTSLSGEPMPVGDIPGWKQVLAQDFNADVALGQFRTVYGAGWDAYNGGEDTSRNVGRPAGQRGMYSAAKTITVQNSILDIRVHTEGTRPYVAALTPVLPTYGQLYGRYAVRFRADLVEGYKIAWLLWPDSENWNEGEIDFPESGLGRNIHGFSHDTTGTPKNNAWAVSTGISMQQWHTAVIEWTPSVLRFKLDDQQWQTSKSAAIPKKSMHWVLQTETQVSATPPPVTATGSVEIDWLAAYSYNP